MDLARVAAPSPAIRTALKAIYAQPPTADDLRTWQSLSRMPWPRGKPRRVAACIGRRGLKTSGLLAWSCVYEALCVDHDAHAAEGSRLHFSVVAPLIAQAKEAVLAIRAVLDQLAPLGVRYVLRDAAEAPEIVITNPRGRCEHIVIVETADAVGVRSKAKPWVGYDEWGFAPSGEGHAVRDVDIERAQSPAQVQFAAPLTLYVSSPGAPGSSFQKHVEKPGRDTLVLRAASWVTNPRITQAQCLREAGGDLDVLAQEYEARRFGYAGENFIDVRALVMGSRYAGKGPRAGSFVVGFDAAQTSDESAFVVASVFEVEVSVGHAPVKHAIVEHVETIAGSRKAPVPIEAIASRAAALSRAFGNAPLVSDRFMGPTMAAELVKLGLREFWDPDDEKVPPLGMFCMRSMAPERQTPRWRMVRELVHGGRLHLPAGDDAEKLRGQLAGLRATQLSSGALKVEGRRDDLTDALALAVPIAMKLPPSADGPMGRVEFRAGPLTWDEGGLSTHGGRFVRTLPNGREVPAECPRWDPYFDVYAEESIANGVSTPAIEEWRRERESMQMRGPINVPLFEGGAGAPWGSGGFKSPGWGFDQKRK
jgi:hypothetical protein